MPNSDHDIIKMIYEQNWLHLRHIEAERHWFSSIYVLAVAGLLGFLGTTGVLASSVELSAIFLTLFVFSAFGFLTSFKLGAEVRHIFSRIRELSKQSLIKEHEEYIGFPDERNRYKPMSLARLYPLLYASTGGLWISLTARPIFDLAISPYYIIGGIVFGIFLEFAYKYD